MERTISHIERLTHYAESIKDHEFLDKIDSIDVSHLNERYHIIQNPHLNPKKNKHHEKSVRFSDEPATIFTYDSDNRITISDSADADLQESLYQKSISNARLYAQDGDIGHLIPETHKIKSQAELMGSPDPQELIDRIMVQCYDALSYRYLQEAVKNAEQGNIEMMQHHLQFIPICSTLASQTSPNMIPILKMGYAGAIKNALRLQKQHGAEKIGIDVIQAQLKFYAEEFNELKNPKLNILL